MPSYNCITQDSDLRVLSYGATTLDAEAGETLHLNVGKRPEGIPLKHTRFLSGGLVEMNGTEKGIVDIVDATEDNLNSSGAFLSTRLYASERDLPRVPAQAGLVAVMATSSGGVPGLLFSHNGTDWHIIDSNRKVSAV